MFLLISILLFHCSPPPPNIDTACYASLTLEYVSTTDLSLYKDIDCDGIPVIEDCDDSNRYSTTTAEDADCDGIRTEDDCNDLDKTVNSCITLSDNKTINYYNHT